MLVLVQSYLQALSRQEKEDEVIDIIIVVWLHFVADFIFQTDKMAQNKSKSNKWLGIHVSVYSLPFLYFGLKYAAINAVAHFCVDWTTSRMTSALWKRNERHWFFVVIGADQAIHMSVLFLTLALVHK